MKTETRDIGCDICPLKNRYEKNPKGFLGRLWRWHIDFCPGWKAYMSSLSDDDRKKVAGKYGQRKYME